MSASGDLNPNAMRVRRRILVFSLIVHRAFGFHAAQAALALVMLACGPITLHRPREQIPLQTAA